MISKDHSEQVVKTSDVIGKDIITKDGDTLGNVEEIVLAKYDGKVCYAVLSFGKFLGLGGDFHAVPWKSLSYDKDKEAFRQGK